ncbi:hypothetical protein BaRGS_00014267, partial [Batillaria attramentaria]
HSGSFRNVQFKERCRVFLFVAGIFPSLEFEVNYVDAQGPGEQDGVHKISIHAYLDTENQFTDSSFQGLTDWLTGKIPSRCPLQLSYRGHITDRICFVEFSWAPTASLVAGDTCCFLFSDRSDDDAGGVAFSTIPFTVVLCWLNRL